jgi:hypothetical protein
MKEGQPVIVSARDLNQAEDGVFEEDIILGPADLAPVPMVKEVRHLLASFSSYPSDDGWVVKLVLQGTVRLTHPGGKEEEIKLATEDYLSLSDNPEESEIPPDKGRFDFLPAIKAVFYAAIPKKDPEGDYGSAVVKEEEYRLTHPKKKDESGEEEKTYRPFKDLKKKISAQEKTAKKR